MTVVAAAFDREVAGTGDARSRIMDSDTKKVLPIDGELRLTRMLVGDRVSGVLSRGAPIDLLDQWGNDHSVGTWLLTPATGPVVRILSRSQLDSDLGPRVGRTVEVTRLEDWDTPRSRRQMFRVIEMLVSDGGNAPPDWVVAQAVQIAMRSPCRSKRGVVLYSPGSRTSSIVGSGLNSPPPGFPCPGRDRCSGKCKDLAVHAEVRALYSVSLDNRDYAVGLDLVHVEVASDGGMVSCDGPSCASCSKQIVDSGFVSGVWLYQWDSPGRASWRRYEVTDFHRASLGNNGLPCPAVEDPGGA